jgi:hypothetical protein
MVRLSSEGNTSETHQKQRNKPNLHEQPSPNADLEQYMSTQFEIIVLGDYKSENICICNH